MRLTAVMTLVGLAFGATTGMAAPILGTGGSWRAGHAAQEDHATFWDGNSWDSYGTRDGGSTFSPCSAGSLVAGTSCGAFPIATSPFALAAGTAFDYWGDESGAADMNYVYGETTGGWYNFAFVGEITGRWNANEFGWYDASNPASRSVIFDAGQSMGAATTVYIPGNFGFYYRNTAGSELFFTQTSLNDAAFNKQQFASFRVGDHDFVGVEDLFSQSAAGSDYDYNDLLVAFERTTVPEPGTLALMGMGAAGLFARVRRRKRA
jgi:PEP-CTERM motif/Domain of unknown function (DUF4114)